MDGMKKAIINALKKPTVTFLLGVFITLLALASITPSVAQSELTKNNEFINNLAQINTEIPKQNSNERDRPSPSNFLSTNQIKVFKDRVIIEQENVLWAGFEDTKSMLPVINKDSNALQIAPNCPEEIKIGDIISYRSDYAEGIIIHRVVHVDEDEQGTYFVLKGDNNPSSDPGRIRCHQIDRKIIGILY